jgi:hypothetical protein
MFAVAPSESWLPVSEVDRRPRAAPLDRRAVAWALVGVAITDVNEGASVRMGSAVGALERDDER